MEVTSTPRLDEQALRRPEFRPGPTVTLADGQAWTIVAPRLVIIPVVVDRKLCGTTFGSEFGSDFERKLVDLREAETVDEEAKAILTIAVDLLDRNYDLAPTDYATLLQYQFSKGSDNRALHRIYNIAMGREVGPEETEGIDPESANDRDLTRDPSPVV